MYKGLPHTNNCMESRGRLAQSEAFQSSDPRPIQLEAKKYVLLKNDFCILGKNCATPLRNLTQQSFRMTGSTIYWTKNESYTLSLRERDT